MNNFERFFGHILFQIKVTRFIGLIKLDQCTVGGESPLPGNFVKDVFVEGHRVQNTPLGVTLYGCTILAQNVEKCSIVKIMK